MGKFRRPAVRWRADQKPATPPKEKKKEEKPKDKK